jgi:hypothetical protein
MNILIKSGIKELVGKKVSITDIPYTVGDTIVCIQKNNLNYGHTIIVTQVYEWDDFKIWKKVITKKSFVVTVIRTSTSTKEIAVKAIDVSSAKVIAIELAGDMEFSEQDAEYAVEHVAIN